MQSLKSPLLHFFAIACLAYGTIFAVEFASEEFNLHLPNIYEKPNLISFNDSDLQSLKQKYKDSPELLAASIDGLIDDELLYQEGLKMGFALNDALIIDRMLKNISYVSDREPEEITEDEYTELLDEEVEIEIFKNDPVIRRRIIQLVEQDFRQRKVIGQPSDETLQAFIDNNSAEFTIPKRISFDQVFINSRQVQAENPELKAITAAITANNNISNDTLNKLGSASILPNSMQLANHNQINQQFGSAFSATVDSLSTDQWHGPIESSFGHHFVRITEIRASEVASLDSVYNRAFLRWLEAEKQVIYRAQLDELRLQYKITVAGQQQNVAIHDFRQQVLAVTSS